MRPENRDAQSTHKHVSRRATISAPLGKPDMRAFTLSITFCLLFVGIAQATGSGGERACSDEPACCAERDCHCHACGKVCRVVCEMKKIKKTVWVVECEEFCVPLPGCCEGKRHCCQTSGCRDSCASPRRPMSVPRCGKVRCRKKLIKKEFTYAVPVYKCVVCGGGCNCNECH